MPGRKCNLCGKRSLVTSKEGSNTSYFSFPRDENLRKKWLDVCHSKIDNIITARICSDHFKEEDFLHNKNGVDEVKKKRLKCNVVPSLYLEARDGKHSRNDVNINSNTENSKDGLKKRDSSKENENIKDQNPALQLKRRGTPGNKNNKSIKEQIKRKSISENNKHLNLLTKQKSGKGLNNKENTKELAKRKIHLKNTSLGIKEISKIRKDKELLKKKSKSLNNISIKKDMDRNKIAKKSINKENKMETIEKKFNNLASDALQDISKEKLPKQIVTKSGEKRPNRKTSYPETNLKDLNESITENTSKLPKELTKHEISENNKEKISQEIVETKYEVEGDSKDIDVDKKATKRKFFQSNGIPRKMLKKRIRLGKDDSEDSEDSSSECTNKNNISRDKITYKSPSEMADNVDLLKYLNYLKEKSRSTDQPILFWVDD